MCYYVLVGAVSLTIITYFIMKLQRHFKPILCVRVLEYNQTGTVEKSPYTQLQVFNMFAVAAIILYGLLPLIILIFIVNCSCDKLRCCKGVKSLLTCKGHVSKQSAASS